MRQGLFVKGMSICRFGIVGAGPIASHFCKGVELVDEFHDRWAHSFVFAIEEAVRCIRESRITSEIMPPEATIACAQVYDKILKG